MAGQGDVVLVTGATAGVGRACAIAFLKAGYRTVLAGRRAELLETVAAEAGVSADQTLCVSCDVSDPDAVDALFQTIKDRFGRLDVVFNNAACRSRSSSAMDQPMWRR
jgi:NAD(P)-dependent dehydrogenase (short-subunit alcohol dehydrogenase family)